MTRNKITKILVRTATVILIATGAIVMNEQTTSAQMRELNPNSYMLPSQTENYPNLNGINNLNILVSINKNRVYIRDGNQVIYTMYCSAGVTDPQTGHSTTPTGTFRIQSERGDSFYNNDLQEGANDWTSFKNHGEYLFHSVPTNAYGQYKPEEAAKLGKETGSHGCIRLSIPDAAWIKDNIPTGTPVTIE